MIHQNTMSALTTDKYVPQTKLEESWDSRGKVLKVIPVGKDSFRKIEAEHREAMIKWEPYSFYRNT